jgi:hypothetical protein
MSKTITAGGAGGLAGGLVFGALMRIMPDTAHGSMIAFAARAAHVANPVAGWVVYALYGLVIGALLGWLLRNARLDEKTALVAGAIYGVGWWIIAVVVLVPALFGFRPLSTPALAQARLVGLPLLIGHIVAGAVMGVVWSQITRWTSPHHGERVIESHARRAA